MAVERIDYSCEEEYQQALQMEESDYCQAIEEEQRRQWEAEHQPQPSSVIVIRCTQRDHGIPCVHEDCAKCRVLMATLNGTCFEIVGEADEWK